MSNYYPFSHESDRYPYEVREQHLATPASVESKQTIRLYFDELLGSIEKGTLELDESGSDVQDFGLFGRELSLFTRLNADGNGRDYCIYIGENVCGEDSKTSPGERSYDTYLNKEYYLLHDGTFYMTMQAEFDDSEYDDTEESEFNRPLDDQTEQAVADYRFVTEGEAQDIILWLDELLDAKSQSHPDSL